MPSSALGWAFVAMLNSHYQSGKATANRFAPGIRLPMSLSPAVLNPTKDVRAVQSHIPGFLRPHQTPWSKSKPKEATANGVQRSAADQTEKIFHDIEREAAKVEPERRNMNLELGRLDLKSENTQKILIPVRQQQKLVHSLGKSAHLRVESKRPLFMKWKLCLGVLGLGSSLLLVSIIDKFVFSRKKLNGRRTPVPEMKARSTSDKHVGEAVSEELPDILVKPFEPKPPLQPSNLKHSRRTALGDSKPCADTCLASEASVRKFFSTADIFNGASPPRQRNALHKALNQSNCVVAAELIETGDELFLNQQTELGITPLMLLAMGYCDEDLIWRLIERRGDASVAFYSESRRTAADYAEEASNRSPEIVDTLRKLEMAEKQRSEMYRCSECSDVVKRRPRLVTYAERAARGEEENALLNDFFSNDCHLSLLQPIYHEINDLRQIRKELTESIAILEVADQVVPGFDSGWHVVDLCCSKAITSVLATLRHPGVTVSAMDILEPRFVPHFAPEDGIQYTRLDVLDDSFIGNLECFVAAASRPTILLGMHLCGKLSLQAIEAFRHIKAIRALVLSPCCTISRDDPTGPQHIYETKEEHDRYNRWARYLEDKLRDAAEDASVTTHVAAEMLSPKNIIISATRPSETLQL